MCWPVVIVRATSDRPCRLDVSTCEDLLGALRACTACVRMLHALLTGPGRAHGDGGRPCAHLVGTGVRCRRQPWRVHAHGRLSGRLGHFDRCSSLSPRSHKTKRARHAVDPGISSSHAAASPLHALICCGRVRASVVWTSGRSRTMRLPCPFLARAGVCL